MPFETIGSPLLWAGFIGFVLAMLAIDLGVFHKNAHEVSLKEAGIWSAVWVALAVAFNFGVYFWFGPDRALEFTTGYLIEKALAVDNIFVFVVIFTTFSIPAIYAGILGFSIVVSLLKSPSGASERRDTPRQPMQS